MTNALEQLRAGIEAADPSCFALAHELGATALPTLKTFAASPSDTSRLYALHCAREIATPEAWSWIAEQCLDPLERVRMTAYKLLARTGPLHNAAQLLEHYASREASFERFTLARLLVLSAASLDLARVHHAWEGETDTFCKRTLWLVRAMLHDPDAISWCENTLRDPDLVARSLGLADMELITSPWILPILLDYLKDTRALRSVEETPFPLAPTAIRVCDFAVARARTILAESFPIMPMPANYTEHELGIVRARVQHHIALTAGSTTASQ